MGTTAEDSLNPETISGGHLVAKALRNEGVDTIFTLSGGNIVDIYDGCVSEGIRIIDFRHEQVAAHAADGYARQTGQTGCLVTTAGPGCCNAVIGLHCVPKRLFCISAVRVRRASICKAPCRSMIMSN